MRPVSTHAETAQGGLRSEPAGLPRHVAIIMDGNGRWAQARGFARVRGHEHGVESVRAITRHAARLGLEQLTLFAFSTENWRRPETEVDRLMELLTHYLVEERDELMENDIRLTAIGRIEELPEDVQRTLAETEALTADNSGMTLCLALNYGARGELADAARTLALDAAAGRIDVAAMSSEEIERELDARTYQPDMPPLDLLVRTAGEQRLSNFLLWQMSYGEFHVADVTWPEFREAALEAALADYGSRKRSFGGLLSS
ncbi:MAG: polyprenyl diphosphate synthase [Planctomycetota bacterium]|nr:polyprenyl diphosphate synthase [Planctomycetota bacterium]